MATQGRAHTAQMPRRRGGGACREMGWASAPVIFRCCSSFVLAGPTAPAEREGRERSPPCLPLARHGNGTGCGSVGHRVGHPARGGRSSPCIPAGRLPGPRQPDDCHTERPMLDALLRAFRCGSMASEAVCAWTWPGVFPEGDPGPCRRPLSHAACSRARRLVLRRARRDRVHCRPIPRSTPGSLARMGVSLGLRSNASPCGTIATADGPAVVVGEVHHPVWPSRSRHPNG